VFRRVASGAAANVIGQVLNAAGQLLLVPVFLRYWGTERYGEWLALSAAAAYLLTLDFGMQTHVINRLTQSYTTGQMEEYARVLHSGLLMSLVVPTVGVAVVLPTIAAVPIEHWLQLRETSHAGAVLVAALLSLQVVYSIAFGLINGVYRSVTEYSRGQMVINFRTLATLGLTGAGVLAGGSLRDVALIQLALLFGTIGFMYVDLSRRHPEIWIGVARGEWKLVREFLRPSLTFLAIQMLSALWVQGMSLYVAAVFGAASLVIFTSLRTLSNLVRQLGSVVHHAAWPEFTAMDALAQGQRLRNLHLVIAKVVTMTAVCGLAFLGVMGDRAVELWTGGRVVYDAPLMWAFLLLALSQAHWTTSGVLISACNRQQTLLRHTAAALLLGFPFGALLARYFGVTGFVAGFTIMDALICGVGLPFVTCRIIGESVRTFFFEVTAKNAVLLAVLLGLVWVSRPLVIVASREALALLLAAAVSGMVALAGSYIVGLSRFERTRLHSAIGAILAR